MLRDLICPRGLVFGLFLILWILPGVAESSDSVESKGAWEYATIGYTRPFGKENSIALRKGSRSYSASNWAELYLEIAGAAGEFGSKHEGTARIQVLNHLGSEGWELVSHVSNRLADRKNQPYGQGETWVFKRPQ